LAGYTTYTFDLELGDIDRGVYQSLTLAISQHPSETLERLVSRVLAWCLEHQEGLSPAGDLSTGDEPAFWVRDLTGSLRDWIEVGSPAPERLHRATKAAERVVVYNHHFSDRWLADVRAARVYAPERLQVFELPAEAVRALAEGLGRRNRWAVSRQEGVVYLQRGAELIEFAVERRSIGVDRR
jgi:uncharacterized protein YaeQ